MDDDELTYQWDLNGDGSADASGISPTIAWTTLYSLGFRQGQTYTVALTVSDGIDTNTNQGTVSVAKPRVSLVAGPDPVLKEHATSPNNGQLAVFRTGATEEGLTVEFTVGGSATNGVDYAAVSGSVTIPVGALFKHIPLVVINDLKVEGDETIILALEDSPNYDIDLASAAATATIEDNDRWDWAQFEGTPLTENDVSQAKLLPGFDVAGQNPAYMAIAGSISATNNSVSADLAGSFVNPGFFTDETRHIQDALSIQFGFVEDTGRIYVSNSVGSGIEQDGSLKGAIGYSYAIDNSGESFHTVTVTVKLSVVVEAQITETIEGGGSGTNGSLTGSAKYAVSEISEIGGELEKDTLFTLKLEVVEDNE